MKRLVIAGGGTAGWLTAHYLDQAINGVAPRVEITLVESRQIGRIGVGEATVPTLRETLRTIGLDEAEFIRQTHATFKHGIDFRDWCRKGHSFFHPFDRSSAPGLDKANSAFLLSDFTTPYADLVTTQRVLAMKGRAPKSASTPGYDCHLGYAYHLDAEALADMLSEHRRDRIKHIEGKIAGIERSEHGVAALLLEGGQRVEGDLFVDCTGFRSLLLSELGPKRVDYSKGLICDRAVAFRLPFDEKGRPLPPYTAATAMDAGWRWEITLQNRLGSGYVYCSSFKNEDAAEAELRSAIGVPDDVDARHIRFDAYRMEEPWIGNVVAIGLSGGFLEPLESTGIFLIEFAAKMLAEHFPYGPVPGPLRYRFNERMAKIYENVVPLLNLHYCLTQRDDTPFWRQVSRPEHRFPATNALLDLWSFKPPSGSDFTDTEQLFSWVNYEFILFGMEWRPVGMGVGKKRVAVPELIANDLAHYEKELPDHTHLIRELVG